MTNGTSTPSIPTICVHCGGKLADPQTGRCLSCGKIVMSPQVAAEFAHPTLDRHAGEPRHSPSAAYRYGHDIPERAPAEEPAVAKTPDVEVAEATLAMREYFEQQPSLTPAPNGRATNSSVPAASPSRPEPFKLPGSSKTRAWVQQARVLRDGFVAAAEKAEAAEKAAEHEAQRYRKAALVFTQLLDQVDVEAPVGVEAAAAPAITVRAQGKWSKNADACIDCGRSDTPHCANGRCRTCDNRWRNPPKGARS